MSKEFVVQNNPKRITEALDSLANASGGLRDATPTSSTVNDSATSVQLLAANSSRSDVFIYNDSSATLYVDPSGTASATTSALVIPPNGSAPITPNADGSMYRGVISGIWSSATGGKARIIESTS